MAADPSGLKALRTLLNSADVIVGGDLQGKHAHVRISLPQGEWLGILSRITEAEQDEKMLRVALTDRSADQDRLHRDVTTLAATIEVARDWLRQIDWNWLRELARMHDHAGAAYGQQPKYAAQDTLLNLEHCADALGLTQLDTQATVQRTYDARVVYVVPVTIEHGFAETIADPVIAEAIHNEALNKITNLEVSPVPIRHISDPSLEDEPVDHPF